MRRDNIFLDNPSRTSTLGIQRFGDPFSLTDWPTDDDLRIVVAAPSPWRAILSGRLLKRFGFSQVGRVFRTGRSTWAVELWGRSTKSAA